MDYINHNTTLRTNKHLNFEERFYLEKRIVLGDSIAAISRTLDRSRTTIYTELKRGTVIQIRQGKSQLVYLADSGQATYERQRVGSFNTMRVGAIESFINWIESKTLVDHWSFDAAVGYAKHKRELGKSIELRDPNIETREEFGHWELDTVRGTKDKTDHVLISLLERKSRLYVALRCPSARATDVKETLYAWLNTFKDVNLACLCKTITADNGLEFSEISNLENETLSIYFARPYSAWERGSNERHNGLLRRCIPKGMPIKAVSEETIQRTLQWCNNLPRKLLNYRTPLDIFLEEVNKIVDLDTVQFHIAI